MKRKLIYFVLLIDLYFCSDDFMIYHKLVLLKKNFFRRYNLFLLLCLFYAFSAALILPVGDSRFNKWHEIFMMFFSCHAHKGKVRYICLVCCKT
jgi:hypothetical protein